MPAVSYGEKYKFVQPDGDKLKNSKGNLSSQWKWFEDDVWLRKYEYDMIIAMVTAI